jgi:LuxR family maltose regulon positive regulatory protein
MSRAENKTTPKVIGDMLYHDQGGLTVGSAAWFAWLDQDEHSAFYVETSAGTFTARKEQRRSGRFPRCYWYAYRKQASKLHKMYLGRSEELTSARLVEVAQRLSDQVRP